MRSLLERLRAARRSRTLGATRVALGRGTVDDPTFATPVPRRLSDPLVWSAQVWYARIRRGYPGRPPVVKRQARAWWTERAEPGPSAPSRRPRPLILAVASAWNEGDVIWATVRNLVAQGVEGVFVIDDESSDETAAEARAAGATVVSEASGGGLSEVTRSARMDRLVDEQTAAHGGDVWWVYVDADEFPRGPDGVSIHELVESLPGWVDVVGSRVLEHVPDSASAYRPRTHPASSIRLARWYNNPYCPRGHWKHQLVHVRQPGDLSTLVGAHTVRAGDGRRVREARPSLLMHHAPLRDRARSESWLRAALERRHATSDPQVADRLRRRLEIAELLYADRFAEVPNYVFPGERRRGLVVRDWRELVGAAERDLPTLDPGERS